jgi:hypothetical protein
MDFQMNNPEPGNKVPYKGAVFTRPAHFIALSLLVIFIADAMVVFILDEFPKLDLYAGALLDSALLSVIIFPLLYLLLFRPLYLMVRSYREALQEVKTLRGLIPICMKCKKIRLPDHDEYDQKSWQNIETYIQEHSDTEFSHGLCPECYKVWRKEMGLDPEDTAPKKWEKKGRSL